MKPQTRRIANKIKSKNPTSNSPMTLIMAMKKISQKEAGKQKEKTMQMSWFLTRILAQRTLMNIWKTSKNEMRLEPI